MYLKKLENAYIKNIAYLISMFYSMFWDAQRYDFTEVGDSDDGLI